MKILKTITEFRAEHQKLLVKKPGSSLGLVATMGFLHEGHIELVKQAAAENDAVVVTIFVNPTQFGPNEDFASYPRDTDHDLALLRAAGATFVFLPTVEEIYPAGFQSFVEVEKVSQGLEGGRRPGHFRGVSTVVAKLFNITQPERAYFGQKDAQQVAVIRQMVRDLAFPIELKIVPIVRAADGLALSSRNVYLSPTERAVAPVLFRSLQQAKKLYATGERRPEVLKKTVLKILASEPLANIDYVSVADAESLKELTETSEKPILISMAVRFGKTRLIDNVILSPC